MRQRRVAERTIPAGTAASEGKQPFVYQIVGLIIEANVEMHFAATVLPILVIVFKFGLNAVRWNIRCHPEVEIDVLGRFTQTDPTLWLKPLVTVVHPDGLHDKNAIT